MTPAEYSRQIVGYGRRLRVQARNDVVLAYQTASFTRVHKLPPLRTVLEKLDRAADGARRPPQDVDAMKAAAKAWTLFLGGTVTKGTKQ